MDLGSIEAWLASVRARPSSPSVLEVRAALRNIKDKAVAEGDEPLAKKVWCFEQVLSVQEEYIDAYALLRTSRFYDAWCKLEQTELALRFLLPHGDGLALGFELSLIRRMIERLQGLFPYAVFFSPEILAHEKRCSICDSVVRIRHPCGHRVGEIYSGERCSRIVTKADFVGVSLVKSPVQKYSVPFMTDPTTGESRDHYDYKLVRYLAERWDSPFQEFTYEWSERVEPHQRFVGTGRNEQCPCGSGTKYKRCCLRGPGVKVKHCEFDFR